MSVTFGCPGAQDKTIPCRICAMDLADGYTQAGETCSRGCPGTEEVSTAPECNFANVNARAVLEALGISSPELYGEIKHEDLPSFIRKIIRVMNTQAVHGMTRETRESGGTGTGHCRVIECGTSVERCTERLDQLLTLAKWAQENNLGISWG
ncbi:MAG: hypothetical protein WC551_08870 [Patescibacteria group bacterium]